MIKAIEIYDDFGRHIGTTNTRVPKEMYSDEDAYEVALNKALGTFTRWIKVNRKDEAIEYFSWDWA